MPGVTAEPFACNQNPTTWKYYSLKSCVAAFGGAQKHFYLIKHTLACTCACAATRTHSFRPIYYMSAVQNGAYAPSSF